ncbi:peptidoglycan-binding protein [Candidatus Giovannonibacteria bacterium]|nr:peptidoglycan-binding protein [Candidatus Giovannonibacteria bacterium]
MKIRVSSVAFIFILLGIISPVSSFAAARSLYLGVYGNDVKTLQGKLITLGHLEAGKNTGYFGALTEAALKKFQCAQNIVCKAGAVGYGVYGPKTQAAMALAASFPTNPATLSEKMTPAATGSFEFSGWVPYWRAATGTEDALNHITQLKSVMPFGYTMKSDGTLADTARLSEEPWKSFIAAAKAAKVRVVPTVMWGNGDSIHAILSDTGKRIALEDEIARVVKENGFDGIDIDFEAKNRETINYFSTFLKGLYQRMGSKWVYCTVEARMPLEHRFSPGAVIPPDATDYANDYIALNKYCDRVEIMAYDQGTIDIYLNGLRAAPYAPVSDPAWVEGLVMLAARTIDRNKLIIGIPTYGYEYQVTPLANSKYQYKLLWPFNPKYATDIGAKLGIAPARNSAHEIAFTYDAKLLEPAPTGADSTQAQQRIASTSISENSGQTAAILGPFNYLSWSDANAIQEKVELAKSLGVRGVAVFKIDGGEDPGMWGVLK